MNQNQRIVAVAVAILLMGMLLYPPFHLVVDRGTFNRGYNFIFDPPEGTATINIVQVLLQMIVVGVVGGIAWYLFKEKS